jgi:hypothetical protein
MPAVMGSATVLVSANDLAPEDLAASASPNEPTELRSGGRKGRAPRFERRSSFSLAPAGLCDAKRSSRTLTRWRDEHNQVQEPVGTGISRLVALWNVPRSAAGSSEGSSSRWRCSCSCNWCRTGGGTRTHPCKRTRHGPTRSAPLSLATPATPATATRRTGRSTVTGPRRVVQRSWECWLVDGPLLGVLGGGEAAE